LEFEKNNNIRSTFFLKAGGKTKHDISYSLKSRYIKNLVKSLKNDDFDIGLHPSYNAYNNNDMMYNEKMKLLESGIGTKIGVREHFLRYDINITSKMQDKLGFIYDSTIGFHDYEGFRASYCLPYRIYDIIEDRALNIWEIPLIIMDATLNDYRKLNKTESLDVVKKLIDVIKKYKGTGVLLFHNTCYDEFDFKGWGEVYEKSILYAQKENAFIGSLREILDSYVKSI
jgi:hypothetical protein